MNDKERVIASMRWYIKTGGRPDSITIAAWMNSLEQDEQQTSPSPEGQGCAGESSVQPEAKVLDELRARAKSLAMKSFYEGRLDVLTTCAIFNKWLDELSETKQEVTD